MPNAFLFVARAPRGWLAHFATTTESREWLDADVPAWQRFPDQLVLRVLDELEEEEGWRHVRVMSENVPTTGEAFRFFLHRK